MFDLRKELSRKIWNIGFIDAHHLDDVVHKRWDIQFLVHHEKKWFADPFILDVLDHEIHLLVEEMDFSRTTGRIALLKVDRQTYELKSVKILLELDSHLSFPAIIRKDNRVYVYPENSKSGSLKLYEYHVEEERLSLVEHMIDMPLTDAIYYKDGEGDYVFSTVMPDPNGKTLYVYRKEGNTFGLFQEIVFNDNSARNAGDVFRMDGMLVRPTQNCNDYYGSGMVFQRMEKENGIFRFEEIGRVNPPSRYNGLHTFNQYKGVTVVDVRQAAHPLIHSLYIHLGKAFRRL